MGILTEKHNISFVPHPFNNDRTAWRKFGLPMLLVEPDRRDLLGNPIENSNVQSVRIAIEDVPRKSRVAGHDHVGLLFPDRELFAITLSTQQLYNRLLEPNGQDFFKPDGTPVAFKDAVTGDLMQYTTRSGVRDTITYLTSANYYDLSDQSIETEELPPDYYFISYQATYFARITSGGTKNQLICIDISKLATAVFRFRFNHPGQVMEESVRLTPAPYFDNVKKAQDTTIEFYRPFTDALQDIFDEQVLIENLNWIDNITPEFIPYLSFLLGLDIPFYPKSLDQLRRTMLRNIVRLQQLKGSRRALIDLFELFGFNIFIINLFWSKNGERLIRPGASLPDDFADQEIDVTSAVQIEPVLAEYDTDGFGELQVPLLFRPTELVTNEGIASVVESGDVIVDAYLVDKDSEAHTQLQAILTASNADPSGYGKSVGGDLPLITGVGIRGYSQIIIEGPQGLATDETLSGIQPPFIKVGVTLDRSQSILNLTFNGAILFEEPNPVEAKSSPGIVLFAFATYNRQELVVPDALSDLQSNRFDLQLLTRDGEQITPDVLEFIIDFLFKLKAFHSLLNVIIISLDLNETYEVTNFCIGGDFDTRFDTDAGKLQVPPAIIPLTPVEGDCNIDAKSLGYKPEDCLLRERKLENLPEEHAAWQALDDRDGLTATGNTKPAQPTSSSRSECKFNDRGQDRIIVAPKVVDSDIIDHPSPLASGASAASESSLDESPIDDIVDGVFYPTGDDASTNKNTKGYGSYTREFTIPTTPFCDEDGVTDFCYKGRVEDELLHQESMANEALFRCHPCQLGIGSGVYYTYPVPSTQVVSSSPRIFSGGTKGGGEIGYLRSTQSTALSHSYDKHLPRNQNNYLGRLLRAYDTPSLTSLHFTNRGFLDDSTLNQANYLAIQRPETDIELPLLHFPGCRFATLGNLKNDFSHPTWRAKPWDDDYSVPCGPRGQACSIKPTYLNFALVENTAGDLVLQFDDIAFKITGNNLEPDIPSLGDHTLSSDAAFDADDVVHSVYMDDFDSHPAITLENVCPCEETQGMGVIEVSEAIFSSARTCATALLDICDGYPCTNGFQDYTGEDLGRNGLYDDFIEQEGIPQLEDPTTVQVLFSLISGIRTTTGFRLDCGCSVVDCGVTTGAAGDVVLPCNSDFYLDQDNERDFNCDQIVVEASVLLEETIGGGSLKLDGSIPSLFELLTTS